MSATGTQGLAPHQDVDVADYVARVRRALDDLPAEVVDELTLGMAADLAEIRAEAGSLVERLGTPERCADELRAAADLPPRAAVTPRTRGMRGVTALSAGVTRRWQHLRAEHAWLRAATDYVQTLRPAWWLLRGFLAVWVVGAWLQWDGGVSLLLLVPAVVGSVWLGRRHPGLGPRGRRWLRAADAVAVVVALAFGVQLVDRFLVTRDAPQERIAYVDGHHEGLVHDGEPVSDLFVYDEQGRPVPRARLVDADGTELTRAPEVVVDDADRRPAVDIYSRTYANVYPVGERGGDPWHPTAAADGAPAPWVPPLQLPPLAAATPTATPSTTTGSPLSPGATRPTPSTGAATSPAAASTPATSIPGTGAPAVAPVPPAAATSPAAPSAATGIPAPR